VVLAAYANSLGNGFAMDANYLVLQDPRIREVTGENLRLIAQNDYWWPTFTLGVYRPLTTLSYLVNWSVLGNGGSATGYHLLNLLLHAVNVWLVYLLARRVSGGTGTAFFAAALWAAHPVGVECVSNVSGRGDLLAAMAVLGGLLLYARGAHWAALFGVAVAGVFAKENAAVLLGLMVLWDVAFGGWTRKRLPMYAAVAASLGMLWGVRQLVYRDAPWMEWPVVDNPLLAAGFWTAKLTAVKVIGMDLWLLVCPWRLAYDRSYGEIVPVAAGDTGAWIALAVAAGVVAVAIARRRRDPVIFFATGFFGIALLPTSNLVLAIGNIMAERFLYLPAVGFAIAVAALGSRLPVGRARTAIAAGMLVLCVGRTFARNPAWRDNLALASSDVATAPRSFRVHEMLAHALHEQDARGNLDATIAEEERAWEILRGLPVAQIPVATPMNLGGYYLEKGDAAGPSAKAWYEKAAAVLLRGREISQAVEKSWDEAQQAHGKPLHGRAASPNLYFNLGQAYGSLGKYEEALEALRFGRAVDPGQVQFYDSMAAAYAGLGRREEAAMVMEEKKVVEGGATGSCAAIEDLSKAWQEARRPEKAAEVRGKGCGAGR
jgi:tetratricopeptide (TPR) repeat protein